MATPEINENCHHVQNDPHKCKIKLEKFHFDILCRCGVIKESLPGGGIRPSDEIGLRGGGGGGESAPRSERVFQIPVQIGLKTVESYKIDSQIRF